MFLILWKIIQSCRLPQYALCQKGVFRCSMLVLRGFRTALNSSSTLDIKGHLSEDLEGTIQLLRKATKSVNKIQDWWKYFYFKLLNQIPFWGTLNITYRNMCSHHLMKFLIIMHVHTDKNWTDFSFWNKHVSIMTLFD